MLLGREGRVVEGLAAVGCAFHEVFRDVEPEVRTGQPSLLRAEPKAIFIAMEVELVLLGGLERQELHVLPGEDEGVACAGELALVQQEVFVEEAAEDVVPVRVDEEEQLVQASQTPDHVHEGVAVDEPVEHQAPGLRGEVVRETRPDLCHRLLPRLRLCL